MESVDLRVLLSFMQMWLSLFLFPCTFLLSALPHHFLWFSLRFSLWWPCMECLWCDHMVPLCPFYLTGPFSQCLFSQTLFSGPRTSWKKYLKSLDPVGMRRNSSLQGHWPPNLQKIDHIRPCTSSSWEERISATKPSLVLSYDLVLLEASCWGWGTGYVGGGKCTSMKWWVLKYCMNET